MSIFRKVPYIEAKLGALSSTQLATFKSVINSTNDGDVTFSLVNQEILLRSYIEEEELTDFISAITFELDKDHVYSGFVVYAGNPAWCMFITYNRHENVHIYEIDLANSTYKRINEECTIEEVRRVLVDKKSEGDVDPAKLLAVLEGDNGISVDLDEEGTKAVASIDMTGAYANKVLGTTDGENVSWVDGLPPVSEAEVGQFLKYINTGVAWCNLPTELPTYPTTDGTYVLKCVVADGVATLSWVAE